MELENLVQKLRLLSPLDFEVFKRAVEVVKKKKRKSFTVWDLKTEDLDISKVKMSLRYLQEFSYIKLVNSREWRYKLFHEDVELYEKALKAIEEERRN